MTGFTELTLTGFTELTRKGRSRKQIILLSLLNPVNLVNPVLVLSLSSYSTAPVTACLLLAVLVGLPLPTSSCTPFAPLSPSSDNRSCLVNHLAGDNLRAHHQRRR
jgi:hypothetical protein